MVKCNTMPEVRREIDRIDRQLVKLLAERQGYIEQAGAIKGERTAVRDNARIED
ncbi:MAG: chorismate mutase, partial [Parvibaculum sp.]|nr:chorismate mutase [Parvibaculum sp.]